MLNSSCPAMSCQVVLSRFFAWNFRFSKWCRFWTLFRKVLDFRSRCDGNTDDRGLSEAVPLSQFCSKLQIGLALSFAFGCGKFWGWGFLSEDSHSHGAGSLSVEVFCLVALLGPRLKRRWFRVGWGHPGRSKMSSWKPWRKCRKRRVQLMWSILS